jgi:hypothetical protein
MSGVFPARYSGRCATDCGSRIEPGDDVCFVDDELVHADCADQPKRQAVTERPVCTQCWMVHAGECL